VRIRVNGQEHHLEESVTVAKLLADLGLPSDGVAVAVDRAVVPRSRHAETPLADGADVEIIRAVGGG
jgi:sulfur carrier protein